MTVMQNRIGQWLLLFLVSLAGLVQAGCESACVTQYRSGGGVWCTDTRSKYCEDIYCDGVGSTRTWCAHYDESCSDLGLNTGRANQDWTPPRSPRPSWTMGDFPGFGGGADAPGGGGGGGGATPGCGGDVEGCANSAWTCAPDGQATPLCQAACAYDRACHPEGVQASCTNLERLIELGGGDMACCPVCRSTTRAPGGPGFGGDGGGGGGGAGGDDGGGWGGDGGGGDGFGGDGGGGGGEGQADPNAPSDVSFYSRRDFGCGNISIQLQGAGSRTLSQYHPDGIGSCGSPGAATFSNLSPGSYTVRASCSDRSWNDTFSLPPNTCLRYELR